jgi:hypothetical protein
MADVPASRRAYRISQLRRCLAVCAAVLLAIAPLAHLSPKAAPAAAAPWHVAGGGDVQAGHPGLGLRGDLPNTGVLPRLLYVEAALAPPPPKPALPRLHASIDPLARPAPGVRPQSRTGTGFHRSSVGTARTPTGPPA